MRTVDANWAALAATGNFRLETKVVIGGKEYTTITPPIVDRVGMSAPLSVGCCINSSLNFSIRTDDEIAESAAVEVLCRLTDGTAATVCSEWLTFGTFYIAKRGDKTNSGLVELECYDAMLKANTKYFPDTITESWPKPMSEVVEEIAELMGVTVDERTVIKTGDAYKVLYNSRHSAYQVLCYIAACHGGNFVITENNTLRLIPLVSAPSADEVPEGVLNVPAVLGSLVTGAPVTVTGVKLTNTDGTAFTAGTTDGAVLTVQSIPYAVQSIADDLLADYEGLRYVPFTAKKAIYDPAAELGDFVAIGDRVVSVLYAQTLTLNHGFRANIEAPTSQESTSEYPYPSLPSQIADDAARRVQSAIEMELDQITMEVTEEVGEDGEVVAARITLKIGHNSYSGLIKMEGNVQITGQLVADALYSMMGEIVDLSVSRLSTSRRIVRYLARDTSDDNFILVEGQSISFISGVTTGSTEQAVNPQGTPLYWEADPDTATLGDDGYPYIDGERIFMTTKETPWPVTVYSYTEGTKRHISFIDINGNGAYIPVDVYGQGDGTGANRGMVFKDTDEFTLGYVTSDRKAVKITMGNDGYLDLYGQRKPLKLDFSNFDNGSWTENLDGIVDDIVYNVTFDDAGRPVKIIDEVGHETQIVW